MPQSHASGARTETRTIACTSVRNNKTFAPSWSLHVLRQTGEPYPSVFFPRTITALISILLLPGTPRHHQTLQCTLSSSFTGALKPALAPRRI